MGRLCGISGAALSCFFAAGLALTGGCKAKPAFDPLRASPLNRQSAMANDHNTKIQWESSPISDGVFAGFEQLAWRNGADTEALVTNGTHLFQVSESFPLPSTKLSPEQTKFLRITGRSPDWLLNSQVSVRAGAFFLENAERSLLLDAGSVEGPLHDEFKNHCVSVYRNGGRGYTFLDGYVFGCTRTGDGQMRLELMSESVCRAVGPHACVSTTSE